MDISKDVGGDSGQKLSLYFYCYVKQKVLANQQLNGSHITASGLKLPSLELHHLKPLPFFPQSLIFKGRLNLAKNRIKSPFSREVPGLLVI